MAGTTTSTRRQPKLTLAELRQRHPRSILSWEPSRKRPSLAELRQRLDSRNEQADAVLPVVVVDSPGVQVATDARLTKRPDINVIRSSILARREACEHGHTQRPVTEYKCTPLQAETAEWLSEVEWNLMVTLTFKGERGVSKALAERLFGRFIPRLRDVVLRKGSRKRVRMAPIIEDSKDQLREAGVTMDGREGTHIHLLLQVRGDDPYKYKEEIRKAWRATNRLCGEPLVHCPNSDEWYLPLTSVEMRERLTGYVLKHHGTDTLGLLIQYLHLD